MQKMAPEQQEKDINSFSWGGNKPESLILSFFSQEHRKTKLENVGPTFSSFIPLPSYPSL